MMCFRDRTFCGAACETADCSRRWTPDLEAQAERWWGGPGAPVAMSDFSLRCPDFAPSHLHEPQSPTEQNQGEG